MKKTIIFTIILLIILLIAVSVTLFVMPKEQKAEPEEQETFQTDYTILTSMEEYLVVKQCLNEYIDSIKLLSSDSEILYSVLDMDYLSYNKLTTSNIKNFYENNFNKTEIIIDEIYKKDFSKNYSLYIVYGRERNLENNKINNCDFVVKINKNDSTFSIFLNDYLKQLDTDKMPNENNREMYLTAILEKENILKNDYNVFKKEELSKDSMVKEIAEDYFNHYKNNLLYDRKKLYETLNEEYKEKKFADYNDFEKYIDRNIDFFSKCNLESGRYHIDDDNKISYICIDNYGRKYTFQENSMMNYKLFWDSYTIDSDSIKEKYVTVYDNEKMQYNINKFILALNDKDYDYAYNVLNEDFKNNIFPTQESFIEFVNNNLFGVMSFEFAEYVNQGKLHIYNVRIKDMQNSKNKSIVVQFIMILKENMEFEIAFSIQ